MKKINITVVSVVTVAVAVVSVVTVVVVVVSETIDKGKKVNAVVNVDVVGCDDEDDDDSFVKNGAISS